jgi:hypothetical protein
VIVIDRLLAGGIGWVLKRLADVADAELVDDASLREELLAAQMRLELGEIDEAEFQAIEDSVLARMRQVRERRASTESPGEGMRYAVEAIEADIGDEGDERGDPRGSLRAAPRAAQRRKRAGGKRRSTR